MGLLCRFAVIASADFCVYSAVASISSLTWHTSVSMTTVEFRPWHPSSQHHHDPHRDPAFSVDGRPPLPAYSADDQMGDHECGGSFLKAPAFDHVPERRRRLPSHVMMVRSWALH